MPRGHEGCLHAAPAAGHAVLSLIMCQVPAQRPFAGPAVYQGQELLRGDCMLYAEPFASLPSCQDACQLDGIEAM